MDMLYCTYYGSEYMLKHTYLPHTIQDLLAMQVMVPAQFGWCGQRLVSSAQRCLQSIQGGAASHPDTIPRPRPIRLIYPHHACVRRKAGHKHAAMCAASWPLLDHKRVTDVMDPLLERGVVAIARNTYRTVPFRWRTSPSKLKGQKDAPRSLSVALLGEA